MDCTRFRIVCTVYQAFNPSMHQCSCAHGTRLNCSKELTVSQAMVTQVRTRLSKSDNLSVGGGIGVGEVAIPASANNFAVADDDRAYGDLARF